MPQHCAPGRKNTRESVCALGVILIAPALRNFLSDRMKVLLIGSGGREHALFWKLSQSPGLRQLDVFPGNGGFPEASLLPADSMHLSDMRSVVDFVTKGGYNLVVAGPEQPLTDGITDALSGICPVFGPTAKAARLEASKDFCKSFMVRYKIPTASAEAFTNLPEALRYLETRAIPIVIKADGLAAGKGVTVAQTRGQAEAALRDCLEKNRFGQSGRKVLIEDFLPGEEASVFALCDGEKALPMMAAQDHKRAFDNDQGPNTGGMGAFTPVRMMTPSVMERVQKEILDPVVRGMKAEGMPYRGLLYAGLMIHNGVPSVVEFNVRFGDPETQALLRLMDEDLLELCMKCASGVLPDRQLKFLNQTSLVVVVAAEGYPDEYKKNIPLKNVDRTEGDIIIFHAGTKKVGHDYFSTGGRILGLTSVGINAEEARKKAYDALKNLEVPGIFYRKDIGGKALDGNLTGGSF